MTNPVIMQLKIEKSKAEKEYREYQLKLTRLIRELAALTNPYFNEIEEIQAEEIEQLGDELLQCKTKAGEVQAKIRKLNREIGG